MADEITPNPNPNPDPNPAPNPAPSPDPAPTPAPSSWIDGFSEDLKGYVENKGFKDPATVVDSYRNLEKLLGSRDKLLKLPDKEDDAEAWKEIYNKLGRPEKPEDYKLQAPDMDKDNGFSKWAEGTFHELGLSRKQAEGLAQKWNDYVAQGAQSLKENAQEKLKQEEAALKKEWGAAYEQNANIVDRAASALGLDDKTLQSLRDSMGSAAAMKFIHNLGTKLGEGEYVSGNNQGGGFGVLSPAAARNRIQALKADPDFVRRYTSGDAAAREEMTRLHQWANPEV